MNGVLPTVSLVAAIIAFRSLLALQRQRARIASGRVELLDPVFYSDVRTLDEVIRRYGPPDEERRLTLESPDELKPGWYVRSAVVCDCATLGAFTIGGGLSRLEQPGWAWTFLAAACVLQFLRVLAGVVLFAPLIREQWRLENALEEHSESEDES